MWYLFAGKLMSLLTYFVFYKLLITPYDLDLLNRVFGWFLIEHVYEEYNVTAGAFFFINSDFRTLIKNLLIVVRNIVVWSHILTLTEFVLTISILVLLMYFLFYFLKINKIKNRKTEIIILIYYIFVIYILLLKTFTSFNMVDISFIFKPILILVFCFYAMFVSCKSIFNYYENTSNNKNPNFIALIKASFYLLSLVIVTLIFFKSIVFINLINNNFLQEFVIKILLVYTYIYYCIV